LRNEIRASDLLKAFNVVDLDMFFRVTEFLKTKNAAAAVTLVDEIMKNGYDLREFTGGWRNILEIFSSFMPPARRSSWRFRAVETAVRIGRKKFSGKPIFCGISSKPTNLSNRSDGRHSRGTALKRRCFRWCPWKDRKNWRAYPAV